mmetsp:Transcript_36630/g.67145  ORF Transcript_36630/g.67145 Transcript_36630/m.67145 type:complete len:278 (-) Transcript_36630:34-867(-)
MKLPFLLTTFLAVAVGYQRNPGKDDYMDYVEGAVKQVSGRTGASHHSSTSPSSFTQNSFCVKRFCINPVFPAFEYFGNSVLAQHDVINWTCVDGSHNSALSSFSSFCSRVISEYSFSLPSPVAPDQQAAQQTTIIAQQSKQAVEMYAAHLAGMGHDWWDYTQPWDHDDCIQSVWRMSCYTYFPRCNEVHSGRYLRPCRSSCENYVKACHVECCDEGLQCVFSHRQEREDGTSFYEEGYADHTGPSAFCTGGAQSTTPLLGLFFLAFQVLAGLDRHAT